MERRAAGAHLQADRLLDQGVPRRRPVGHHRAAAGAGVQALRRHQGRVAPQGQAGRAAQGLRVRPAGVREGRAGAAAELRLQEQQPRCFRYGRLLLQNFLQEDEVEGGKVL